MFKRAKPKARTVQELTAGDPAWPTIQGWAASSRRTVQVLGGSAQERLETLVHLQVTTHSVLGAMAAETSGMVLDHGWLRLLGGGGSTLVDLATASGMGDPLRGVESPSSITVAHDVLGGRFAINGGGLPVAMGEVAYLGPETLAWNGTGERHSGWLEWVLTGDTETFYRGVRWPGWQAEAEAVPLDEGLAVHPPVFTREAVVDMAGTTRTAVPWATLMEQQQAWMVKLLDVPDGEAFRLRVEER